MAQTSWDLTIATDAGVPALRLVGVRGESRMSRLFRYEAVVEADVALNADQKKLLLNARCALGIGKDDRGVVCGVIDEISVRESSPWRAVLTVIPAVSLLDHGSVSRCYRGKTVVELVENRLKAYGMTSGVHYALHTKPDTYHARPFVAQRDESDWAFVSRWMAYYGMYCWFATGDGGDVMHISDDIALTRSAGRRHELPVSERSSLEHARPVLADVWESTSRGRREARVFGYWLDKPAAEVHGGRARDAGLGRVWLHRCTEPHDEHGEAQLLAEREAERFAVESHRIHAMCNDPAVAVGDVVATSLKDENRELLVVGTSCAVGLDASETAAAGTVAPVYRAELELVDATEAYRPPMPAWPRAPSLDVAFVERASGGEHDEVPPYANPDKAGRYAVRFAHVALEHDGRTPPLRVAQLTSGSVEGTHFLLREGTPVLIAYADGDLDRPFIVGAVSHAKTANVADHDQKQVTVRARVWRTSPLLQMTWVLMPPRSPLGMVSVALPVAGPSSPV